MAVTVTFDAAPDGRAVAGDRAIRRGKLNVGTYTSGGIAVTKASFDLPVTLNDVYLQSSGGYEATFDKTNSKIMVYEQSDSDNAVPLVESDAVDLSATEFRFRAEGR